MIGFTLKDSRRIEHIVHPATNVAISALKHLKDEEGAQRSGASKHILDIGCGSGILSLYCTELWGNARIIASDISRLAIEEMQENLAGNGLDDEQIICVQAEGLDHQQIEQGAPYDLIIANILAKWHLKYLRDMQAALRPNGYIVLSGIQVWQLQEIEQSMPYAKLKITKKLESRGWVGLTLTQEA